MQETSSKMENESRNLVGLRELAEFLNVTKVTAWKLKNSGRIPYISIGKKFIFNSSEVMQHITHQVKN